MVKRALVAMLPFAAMGAMASPALAGGSARVSLIGASADEYGSYTVSVADSRPGSTLVLYVDGGAPSRATVSPEGPPAGATARCRDGTYSFSEHRSGTCSSHGGVAEWL